MSCRPAAGQGGRAGRPEHGHLSALQGTQQPRKAQRSARERRRCNHNCYGKQAGRQVAQANVGASPGTITCLEAGNRRRMKKQAGRRQHGWQQAGRGRRAARAAPTRVDVGEGGGRQGPPESVGVLCRGSAPRRSAPARHSCRPSQRCGPHAGPPASPSSEPTLTGQPGAALPLPLLTRWCNDHRILHCQLLLQAELRRGCGRHRARGRL